MGPRILKLKSPAEHRCVGVFTGQQEGYLGVAVCCGEEGLSGFLRVILLRAMAIETCRVGDWEE